MAGRLDLLVHRQKRFLGDVAHELCSPLARIRTGLSVLETRIPDVERKRLEEIEADAAGLASLVEELLAKRRWHESSNRSTARTAPAPAKPAAAALTAPS